MDGLQARLQSFKKSKRVKNPKKSSTTTLKWPHPQEFIANPTTLAEAGFFFDPSYDDPDNVTCFNCDKQLAGWEEDDDPYLIHWNKCAQTCCWAVVQCGLRADMDRSGRFVFPDKTRLPNHKSMEKARLESFTLGKGWVHDKTKNHGANSKSMARAGFTYTPHETGDDLASCLYCDVSLGGWDEDDDPMEEHRKRATKSDTNCPFFEPTVPRQTRSKSKPPSATGTKRRTTSHKRTTSRTKPKSPEVESEQPTTTTTTIEPAPTDAPKRTKVTRSVPSEAIPASDEPEKRKPGKPPKAKVTPEDKPKQPSKVVEVSSDEEPGTQDTVTDTDQELHTAPSTPPRPILHEKKRNHSGRSNTSQSIPQTSNVTTAPSTPPRPILHENKPNHSDRSNASQSLQISNDTTTLSTTPRPVLHENKPNLSGRSNSSQSIPQTSNDTMTLSTPPRPVSHEKKPNHSGQLNAPQSIPQTPNDTMAPSTPPRPILHDEEPNHSGRSNTPQIILQTSNVTIPSTPPRPILHEEEPNHSGRSDAPRNILQTSDDTSTEAQPSAPSVNMTPTTEPPYLPPLSRLPFMPLQTLSDAELDMTVEEWIRYQIEVEQDRFKRDGERELERFKKRAEEVRKAIDGL